MLTPDLLHDYQKKAVNFQCTHPHSMLWLDMGLGKTVITLTSLAHLINTGFLRGVIIVAPIRVIRLVWKQEATKWEHTKHLRFSMVAGTKDQRTRALMRPADVFLINYENLGWLAETLQTYFVKKNRPMPFNGIIWDEISKMKNSATNRVKAFRKIEDQFDWTTGLTGTPASNGYKDLHGQFLVVDRGERLGTSKTAFRTRFYRKVGPYKEVAYEDTEDTIKKLIGDITLEMSAEDYNPLPDLIVNDVEIEMPDDLRGKYEQMEREFFLTLDNGKEIEVFNQASLTNKCLAKGTEVLTYKGWKQIQDIDSSDLVWDGIEWVSVSGVVYNGYKSVTTLWGVKMTPDHKVLTSDGWMEAQEILDEQSSKRYDRAAVRTPFSPCERGEQGNVWDIGASVMESPLRLRKRASHAGAKPEIEAQNESEILRMSSWGYDRHTSFNRHSPMDYLEKHAISLFFSVRQGLGKLRCSGDNCLSRMGSIIRGVLGSNERKLRTTSDTGAHQCERQLREVELSMGNSHRTRKQHPSQCLDRNTGRFDDSCSSCEDLQDQADNSIQKGQERVDGSQTHFAHVYDIVNAGPRHRFTVRGRNGEVFIAHNCLQFSNGAMYPIAGMPLWEPVHDLKLEALEEIIDEAQGSPILCAYAYRSDAQRIMEKFKHLDPINLTDCKSEASLTNAMHRWKTGNCSLMIGHPASMGHGIDGLQKNGHILVWYGLNWSLDLYEQFNARVRRQGQGAPVMCHRILMQRTLDQAQALALDEKATTQSGLRNAVKQYRQSKGV